MEKRKVGIDLDKTLFNCKSILYNFLNALHWNKKKRLKQNEIKKENIYKGSIANKVFRLLNPDFYFTYPNAVESINLMSELGYEVHLVSNRPNIRSIIALTLESLDKCGLKYDKLVLGCNNKQDYAVENGLEFFIDDVEEVCHRFVRETAVKPLCFKPTFKGSDFVRLSLGSVDAFSSWERIGEFFMGESKMNAGDDAFEEIKRGLVEAFRKDACKEVKDNNAPSKTKSSADIGFATPQKT